MRERQRALLVRAKLESSVDFGGAPDGVGATLETQEEDLGRERAEGLVVFAEV